MNCRQLQESLGDHSVGLLDSQTLSDFERHLALCAECAKSARQFRRCLELLDHTASPRPPADLWMSVRAALDVERAVQAHVHAARPFTARWPWRSGLTATAAGFAVAAVLMVGLTAQRTGTGVFVERSPLTVTPAIAGSLDSGPARFRPVSAVPPAPPPVAAGMPLPFPPPYSARRAFPRANPLDPWMTGPWYRREVVPVSNVESSRSFPP